MFRFLAVVGSGVCKTDAAAAWEMHEGAVNLVRLRVLSI